MNTNQWADFAITKVGYDSAKSNITNLEVRRDLGSTLDTPQIYPRKSIVDAIEKGSTFVTATFNGQWQLGSTVRIVIVDNVKYLRTDTNKTAKDNLGSLPTF